MASPLDSTLDSPAWHRSNADEWANTVTHAIGFVLALAGTLVLGGIALDRGELPRLVACGVYLASLMAVYAMSTLSHCARSLKWKRLFRRLDQGSIFLLIVATYTPFSIAFLSGTNWWLLLAAMWVVAIWGFVSKVLFFHRVELVSVAPYVVLGWMPILATPTLIHLMPPNILWWMVTGGVCYTVGILFLVYDERIRHFHAIWHLCVIAGSMCHFYGIWLTVAEVNVV